MLPRANSAAMQLHLNEISKHVSRKAHAVVLMDRAGWHTTDNLVARRPNVLALRGGAVVRHLE